MPHDLAPTDYPALREEILRIIAGGRERARQAVEREKVQTYWEIGRALHTHALAHKERAEFGAQVVAQLAQDLEMSKRLLYQILDFYRAFPIVQTSAQLKWSHYQVLSTIPKQKTRRAYLKAAEERSWSVRELNTAIKTQALESAERQALPEDTPVSAPAPLLKPRYGRLHTFRILQPSPEDPLLLDLGFGIRYAIAERDLEEATGTMMVESEKFGDGRHAYDFIPVKNDPSRLYTFPARVERIIDGDTFLVDVDCGFGVWIRQRLRLRGIDTPELSQETGVRARSFVEEALQRVAFIVLATSRADKYDRYLADVWYLPGEGDAGRVLRDGIFLNQQLLDEGLASVWI